MQHNRRNKRAANINIESNEIRFLKPNKNLQRETDSGRAVSLFPDRLRNFRLVSNPMQSGRDSKRFDETSSSTIIFSSAIESGITCFEWMKLFNIISLTKSMENPHKLTTQSRNMKTTGSSNTTLIKMF
jgi:hypothetical protein